ncbi:MAG TPA: phage holin family protein [Casimicrobiaceae bacterium]|nr:phage holin family protein [Casimicrobiaceae bacterium]
MKEAFARLAESALGAVRTRAELAGVELIYERERLLKRIALLVGGVVALGFAALFVGVFVVAVFWQTHPLAAIASVAVAYAILGAWLVSKARTLGSPSPFAATLAEFEKDRARFAQVMGAPDEP